MPTWAEPAAQLIKTPVAAKSGSSNIDVQALSKKLGFAAHVPKDTEGYFSVLGGTDMYERLQKTEIGKFILDLASREGVDLQDLEEDEDFSMFKSVMGEELFASFGNTSGEQGDHLVKISNSYNYHSMKMLVKMATVSLADEPDYEAMQGLIANLAIGMVNDPKAGLKTLEKAEMPPLTIGFKVSDPEKREMISETILGGFAEMFNSGGPTSEINEVKAGVKVEGGVVLGKEVVALANEDVRQRMSEALGSAATVDKLLNIIEKKNLTLVSGVKGDYIFIFLGDSLDDLKFADKPEDSLLANEGMGFLENYTDKDIRFLLYGEKEGVSNFYGNNRSLGVLASGLKDGLAESDVLGDTRDIQALLGHIAKLEDGIYNMIDIQRTGLVGFIEEGFKVESHGGVSVPFYDLEKPHDFAAAGEMKDLFVFSNFRTNPEVTAKYFDMFDSLGQAAYLTASRFSTLDIESSDFEEFKEGWSLFNEVAAGDLKEVYGALTEDWAAGTGDEGALMIDLKGAFPKVPEVPSAIIDNGVMPRIAYVTPVTDRAKISSSWTRLEKSIANMLKTVEKMGGPTIPMQEIDDNTKGGITYFTTAIPFSTKDARPVVAVNDLRFYIGSSQKLIAEVEANLAAGKKADRKGAYARVDFTKLHSFATDWLNLLKQHETEILTSEYERKDFKEALPDIEKGLKAFKEIQELTMYARNENGELRSSLHFKMN